MRRGDKGERGREREGDKREGKAGKQRGNGNREER